MEKEDVRLKKAGIAAKDRPVEVIRRKEYLTKQEIAISLLNQFQSNFPEIQVSSANADALYGTKSFLEEAEKIYPQIVSQLRGEQKVKVGNIEQTIAQYFSSCKPITKTFLIRGHKKQILTFMSAPLYVVAHEKKRCLIALKYEGETKFRYLVATDMTWRTDDILQSYFLRWLIEVFFEDWKGHEGWGQLAKHTGEEGSRHGLILSLMFDLCLFQHHDQLSSIKQQLPAYTVASITAKARIEGLLLLIQKQFQIPEHYEKLEELSQSIGLIFPLKKSTKHFSGRTMPESKPTTSLKYKKAA